MNLYLSTEVQGCGVLNVLSSVCLIPIRYALNGRSVSIIKTDINDKEREIEKIKPSFRERHVIRTAIITSAVVAGLFFAGVTFQQMALASSGVLLLGITFRALALRSEEIRKLYQTANLIIHDVKPKFTRPAFESTLTTTYTDYKQFHESVLVPMGKALEAKMTKKEIWKDGEFIKKVDDFMELAYEGMKLFYQLLWEENEGDPKKMVTAFEDQGGKYYVAYWDQNLLEMYQGARLNSYWIPYVPDKGLFVSGKTKDWKQPILTEEALQPFVTPGTPQHKWRLYYNDVCSWLEGYGLLEHMKDTRIWKFSVPDDGTRLTGIFDYTEVEAKVNQLKSISSVG